MKDWKIHLLIFPASPSPDYPYHVDQSEQHWYLDQGTHSRCQGLIAVGAKRGYSDGDCKLKVVAGSREALGGGQLVAEAQLVGDEQCEEENGPKVHDQRSGDPNDRNYLMNDPMSLRSEENENSEEEANQ